MAETIYKNTRSPHPVMSVFIVKAFGVTNFRHGRVGKILDDLAPVERFVI
jgi:hypothetical protein